jgi:hypothetical protein
MIDKKIGKAKLSKNVTGNDLNLLTALIWTLLDNLSGSKNDKAGTGKPDKETAKIGLRIIKAFYGSGKIQMDVSENLQLKRSNNQLAVIVANDTFGYNHFPGVWKALVVRYETEHGKFCA